MFKEIHLFINCWMNCSPSTFTIFVWALTERLSPQQLDVNTFTLTIPLQGTPVSKRRADCNREKPNYQISQWNPVAKLSCLLVFWVTDSCPNHNVIFHLPLKMPLHALQRCRLAMIIDIRLQTLSCFLKAFPPSLFLYIFLYWNSNNLWRKDCLNEFSI